MRAGLEVTQKSPRKPPSAPVSGAYLSDDPEIAEIMAAWPTLSDADKAEVLATVRRAES
jgi:hypothetical protein